MAREPQRTQTQKHKHEKCMLLDFCQNDQKPVLHDRAVLGLRASMRRRVAVLGSTDDIAGCGEIPLLHWEREALMDQLKPRLLSGCIVYNELDAHRLECCEA